MTSRERILAAIACGTTDRTPYDITDGRIWPELHNFFYREYGLKEKDEIYNFLDTDLRWIEPSSFNPAPAFSAAVEINVPSEKTALVSAGLMAAVDSPEEVKKLYSPFDPGIFGEFDFVAFRKKWPDNAVAFIPYALPYFWNSCVWFGMDEVFIKIAENPDVYDALLEEMNQNSMAVLKHFLDKAAKYIDIIELWDDVGGQSGMMVSPEWWRRTIKPYLKKEVDFVHSYGLKVFYHSCGAVRPIISDFIDLGIDVFMVFQTNAKNMEPKSIADEFGGKICFYGGLEVQHLLSYGNTEEVEEQVKYNIDCFRDCGGYIAANCHSHISTIKGENIVAMCKTAKCYK